jgi:aryl-alcohol dehydrogenase-like predicted oxidoreductase
LATKVYNPANHPDERPEPNHDQRNLSAMKIKRHIDGSLRRLQTDWVDLYQMHHVDRDVAWDELWEGFSNIQAQGKIVYVGSSNFAGWDIATACQEASKLGKMGLASEQSIYHLDNRMVELEVVPSCRHYGMGLIPWSPLGGGMLGGALQKLDEGRRSNENFAKRVEAKRSQLEKYESLCKDLGHAPAEVALSWLLHNPVVTAPIIGPRTMEQLESAVRATEIELDEATLTKLDEIFPGPGGEAPKAYAW